MACQLKSQRMGFPSLLQDPPPTPDPLPAGYPPKSGMKQFCARHPSHKLLAPHAVVTTGYAPQGGRSQNCGSTALPPHWSQEFSLLEMWRGRERRKGNLSLYHSSYITYILCKRKTSLFISLVRQGWDPHSYCVYWHCPHTIRLWSTMLKERKMPRSTSLCMGL